MKARLLLLALLLIVPAAAADTLTEDFEDYNLIGFEPETRPDQDWYDYGEGTTVGMVSVAAPGINGAKHFRLEAGTTEDASANRATFSLEVPAQLAETTFYVAGVPYSENNQGSQQVISIQSGAPVRSMVQFFLFCNDSANPDGCELRVRWAQFNATGAALIDADQNLTEFKIRVVPNWLTGEYQLFVNDVDDGTFPFLELSRDIGRLKFNQHRADVPLNMSFDDWTVIGTINGTQGAVGGDIAEGIKNFASDIRFTSGGSQFFFGLLLFCVLLAAVIVPMLSLGMDNTVIPAIGFYAVLVVLWLIYMEFWPEWISIALIILVAALVSTVVRRLVLGIKDANNGPSIVAGSLGYFITASAFLAMAGYATPTVALPSAPVEQTADENGLLPADQGYAEQYFECLGGVVSWLVTLGNAQVDCSRKTQTKTWAKITDIFGWIRSSFDFLFQLLTFQLPIPAVFNAMIVLPPAITLATYAIGVIRGAGN